MIGQLNIRQRAEEKEESLSAHAIRSKQSRGRLKDEEPCPIRTAFQRDRDRIIYSNSFRRLKHKTQVFIAPQGDHYVTRLTHSLEVSQIARTIARALNLNEDLTEAISLGHDLGHTPFGHVGEEVLNELYPPGFRHNEQSLRIVDLLENDGKGLNLTWEVRDGIVNHSKTGEKTLKDWGQATSASSGQVNTLEGSIAKISDVVAYVNHDIDDAIRAGVIQENDLPPSATDLLGHSHRERINSLVSDIIKQSWPVTGLSRASSRGNATTRPAIVMSTGVLEATNALRNFLFEKVYDREAAREETGRAREIMRQLYDYFNKHEEKLPPEYRLHRDETERRVVDYIAGMTDQYATRVGEKI
ncbi:MAG: deoxyguanosinetriphosphate triphosphohydrolase [Chloroflexota bacterium]